MGTDHRGRRLGRGGIWLQPIGDEDRKWSIRRKRKRSSSRSGGKFNGPVSPRIPAGRFARASEEFP
jgi:hypothetical protein